MSIHNTAIFLQNCIIVKRTRSQKQYKKQRTETNMNILHYSIPSRQWEEALPIGNGRLGGMIYGTVPTEQIQLNEISVWSGEPKPDADRKEAYKKLPELRRLINEKKYGEAQALMDREFTNFGGGFEAAY